MYLSAGDSAGLVVTIVVYSSAPFFSRICASEATVEFFCPIAT